MHLLNDQLCPLRQDLLSLAFALCPAASGFACVFPVAVEGRWSRHRVYAGRLLLFRFPTETA